MNSNKQQLLKVCTENFFTHPEWDKIISLIELYIKPLEGIDNLDTRGKSNDEIATEIRARQIVVEQLRGFINDSLTLQKAAHTVQKNNRKYK